MLAVHSCMNSCDKDKLDSMCPKNTKCCYSEMAMGNYCVNTDGVTSTVFPNGEQTVASTPANNASGSTFTSNITGIFLSEPRPALRTQNSFKINQVNGMNRKNSIHV